MADEDTLAVTPGETKDEPVNDGIIDLDAVEEVKPETTDDEEAAAKKAAEEPKEDADAKPDGDKEEPKKLSGAQRHKIREARLLAENTELNRKIEELSRPAARAGDERKTPVEADFNGDFFAYQTAKTAFEAGEATRQALREDREAREKSERETAQAKTARERSVAHLERVEGAREVIADFDKVMKGMDGVKVRNDVIEEIMSSDHSAVIAYHLAQNPEKLDAMNQMSARELAREVGRLEATVKLPEAKKATSAPAPLSAPKGGAAPSSQDSILNNWLNKTYPDRRK